MESLLGKSLEQLQSVALQVGLPKYVGKQLADWLYVKRISSFEQMTNISLKGRNALAQSFEIGRHAYAAKAVSQDGTKKYLFEVNFDKHQKQFVETVFIPDSDRGTICVSTQAGCKMACRFCMTGTLGFHGNLTSATILNQLFEVMADNPDIPEGHWNAVYMGEGEPMDNLDQVLMSLTALTNSWGCAWSPKRITVSSVGFLPGLKRYLDECECNLAISLHNPFAIERRTIMPIEKRYCITDVIGLIKKYDFSHQRRVSFEYICWGQQNDTIKHANELVRLLKGLECRINLIRFHEGVDQRRDISNPTDDIHFNPSEESQMIWFRDYLTSKGITTTIRRSRGEDILAACGMLVNALSENK